MPRFLIAAFLLCAGTLTISAAELVWLTDLDEAIKVAKADKKAILVNFTGSDWCGWCIRLKKEVFVQPEFSNVTKDFVLVEVDFPRKTKLAPELEAKNSALAKKFSVEGYPTILLLSSDGSPFGQSGYQEGGPAKYLSHLETLLKNNTSEGRKAFSQAMKEENLIKEYSDELDKLVTPHIEKKDLAATEAAIAQYLKGKELSENGKFMMMANFRIGSVQACKPGDFAALLKVIDELISIGKNHPQLPALISYRAKIAEGKAAAETKK